jgi:glycosyltransferase involved in cell wall biosynthesis
MQFQRVCRNTPPWLISSSLGAFDASMAKCAMMKVSVIIPAYNEEQWLPRTLENINKALAAVACPSEVIVVDNESQDRTGQVAEFFGAQVFREQEHNISRVRNAGATNASGNIFIFIDADTLVAETLFQKIITALADENALAARWLLNTKSHSGGG